MSDSLALFIDFENVAIWAEREFFDLEISRLMEYLQSRGPVVIKRAYADWTRFPRYRDEMLGNSIDLIQLYDVRAGKNRADIRMALDAFETAITRPQVQTIALVTGDSDFGTLVSKLREYGRYVLGLGPSKITHAILVKSCDEFVFLETIFGEAPAAMGRSALSLAEADHLLQKALAVHGRRGELPVLAAKLKQTMLYLDPTFNEENLGYKQFRDWLEDRTELARLFFKDLQLYAAPASFLTPEDMQPAPKEPADHGAALPPLLKPDLATQYRQLFKRSIGVDLETRRDILRDIHRELSLHPEEYSADTLLSELQQRYESQDKMRSRTTLVKVWQTGFRQRAYLYQEGSVSVHSPVRLADDINGEAAFILRAESGFLYVVVNAGLPLDYAELAAVLLNDRSQVDYIQDLLNDLERRGLVTRVGAEYRLAGSEGIPFVDDPVLLPAIRDIQTVYVPDTLPQGAASAHNLARKAMLERSQDFEAAAQSCLWACRLQWDAIERADPDASLKDLRWLIASYASVRAGELSHVHYDHARARPYYLVFFALVQEDDPLWDRMRGLINPMLSYYWLNLAREMRIPMLPVKSPATLAVQIFRHSVPELRARWLEATRQLSQVNPGLLQRVVEQIRLGQPDDPDSSQTVEELERILAE